MADTACMCMDSMLCVFSVSYAVNVHQNYDLINPFSRALQHYFAGALCVALAYCHNLYASLVYQSVWDCITSVSICMIPSHWCINLYDIVSLMDWSVSLVHRSVWYCVTNASICMILYHWRIDLYVNASLEASKNIDGCIQAGAVQSQSLTLANTRSLMFPIDAMYRSVWHCDIDASICMTLYHCCIDLYATVSLLHH